MADTRDNWGLNDEQKTRLLSLGRTSEATNEPLDHAEAREQLLCELLMSTLPISKAVSGTLPELLQGQLRDLRSVAGEPIGDLIENPNTESYILERIKDYAKHEGTESGHEVNEDVYLVIYCAAIASALAFHGKKITEHTEGDLKRFFQSYTEEEWVLQELKELFCKALRMLQESGCQ